MLKSLTPTWIRTSVFRSSRCTDFLPEDLSTTASCVLAITFPVFSEIRNVYLCLFDQQNLSTEENYTSISRYTFAQAMPTNIFKYKH